MHTFADSTSSNNNLLIWSVVIAICTQADNATDLIIVNNNQWFDIIIW